MKLFTEIPENNGIFKNPAVTIGTFDGVHIGHKKIFEELKEAAKVHGGEPVVVTFSKHPKKILKAAKVHHILTTKQEKVEAISACGIENIILLDFTQKMADMMAEDFFCNILVRKLKIKDLVLGYDHAFGKNRKGNIDFLKDLSCAEGVSLKRVEESKHNSKVVSSTWIRSEIEAGNLKLVSELLDRPYSISGTIIHGAGRGKDLGFPTANINPDETDKIIPKDGVYAVYARVRGVRYSGMVNIGNNPTFADNRKAIEVNIFDFSGDLYNTEVVIDFIERIRDEQKFDSVESLVKQIRKDKETTCSILGLDRK